MSNDDWVNDRGEMTAVAQMLIDAAWFTRPEEMLDYIEKPWKWSTERDRWVAAGRPGPRDPSWMQFVESVDDGEGAAETNLS